MKKITKILLGSEDILSRDNEDIFLNIDLRQYFNEIKPSKYENDFDLLNHFNKERNECRNFTIYGLIDSIGEHAPGKFVNVYIPISNPTIVLTGTPRIINIIGETATLSDGSKANLYTKSEVVPLVYNQQNIFGFKRGKYAVDLKDFQWNSVILHYPGDGINTIDVTKKIDLVVYDKQNNFIEYGTDSVVINNDSSVVDINNDFPYFYNRHWIKNSIKAERIVPAFCNFISSSYSSNEGGFIDVQVTLDKPSKHGLESVTIGIDNSGLNGDLRDINIPSPVITWNQGEQVKTVRINIIKDSLVEVNETIRLIFINKINIIDGSPVTTLLNIGDKTPRKYANFNFGRIWKNPIGNLDSSSSFLERDQIMLISLLHPNSDGSPFNLEPSNSFTIDIINDGEDTIFPANSGLSSQELDFPLGTSKTFEINISNISNQIHEVRARLKGRGIIPFSDITINGIEFKNVINSPDLIARWESNSSSYDFTITYESADTVIIRAKYSSVRLNCSSDSDTIEFSEIVAYDPNGMQPFILKLSANWNSNTQCRYRFNLRKSGHRTVEVGNTPLIAESVAPTYYLETAYSNIKANWNNGTCFDIPPPSVIYNNLVSNIIHYHGILFIRDHVKIKTSPEGIDFTIDPNIGLYRRSGPQGRFVTNIVYASCTYTNNSNNFMGGFKPDPYIPTIDTGIIARFDNIYKNSGGSSLSMNLLIDSENSNTCYPIPTTDRSFKIRITNNGVIDVPSPFNGDNETLVVGETREWKIELNPFLPFNIYSNFKFGLFELRLKANSDAVVNTTNQYLSKSKYDIKIFDFASGYNELIDVSTFDRFGNFGLNAFSNYPTWNFFSEYKDVATNFDQKNNTCENKLNLPPGVLNARIAGVILSSDYCASESFHTNFSLKRFWEISSLDSTCTSCSKCTTESQTTIGFGIIKKRVIPFVKI